MTTLSMPNAVDLGQIQDSLHAGQIRALDRAALNGARAQTVDGAAQEFEGMVAAQLLSPMWENMPVDETFGGGIGEETFRGFLLQEYGRIAAKTGAIGISHAVKDVMIRAQGGH